MFEQQLVNGFTLGLIYALIAVGYTMVYGVIELINFAHGEIYMLGAFLTMSCISLGLPLSVSVVVAVLAVAGIGVLLDVMAYRPLRKAPRLAALITAIGMSIFLQNVVLLAQDSKDKAIPNLMPGNLVIGESTMNGVVISYMQILIFVVTFVAMYGLTLFISRSRLGRACRACAEDLKMANLLGINTNGIIALTFVIGAALAAIAAVLISMQYGVINPHIGFLAGIKAFTAAVLGGIGSIPGAMLGGLVLGVAEAFGADIFGDQYKDVVAFSLLVLVLLFRPTGILGRPEVEKV